MPHLSEKNAALLTKVREMGVCEASGLSSDELERASHLTEQGLLEEEHYNPHSVGGSGESIYIAPVFVTDRRYKLSPAGEDALCAFEQEHQEKAKAERQQRFENKISVASVLVPLITFFLGLVVEYYAGVVGLVVSLFAE